MKENKEELEIQLFSSPNEYEVNQICVILNSNNIPFILQHDGSGAYMNLYFGHSIQEKRILINPSDYDKAIELISSFTSQDIPEEIIETSEQSEQEDDTTSTYISLRRILGLLILGMPILLILLLILLSIIM